MQIVEALDDSGFPPDCNYVPVVILMVLSYYLRHPLSLHSMNSVTWGLQVQCGTLTKANVRGTITTLLDQAGNIAFMQASLLCVDWALLMFSPQPLSQKASFGAALALLVAMLLNIRELGTLALEGISRKNRFL